MVTKNYLFVNEKIKIKTKDGQIYHLGKPNDFGERGLYSDSGAVFFNLCYPFSLKEGELFRVMADGLWGSPSEIISITIIDN